MTIYAMVENFMDTLNTKMTWTQLATAIGIDPSSFSHQKKGSEIKFSHLKKIAKVLAGDRYGDLLKQWCLKLQKPQSVKYALEYLAINGFKNELRCMIETIKNGKPSRDLLDWADAYSLVDMHINNLPPGEILKELRLFSPKSLETIVISSIIEIYCNYRLNELNSMERLCSAIEPSINAIEDEYIRVRYMVRLKEVLANVYLFNFNEPEKARIYANEILSSDISAKFTCNSYYIVGMSYLYEDFDKCYENMIKYREVSNRVGHQKIVDMIDNCNIPFVLSVFRKHTEAPSTEDVSELAHYEAIYGDKAKAIELIDQAIAEKKTGYRLYYKALATGDKSIFMESLAFFITKSGDKFAARLPYEHLKDDPVYRGTADILLGA